MDNIQTNILIIGKSGSGKSALLNYLFGREVEKSAGGRPVTSEGLHHHLLSINESFKINIYDSWGLEPDNYSKWEKMIDDEFTKHEGQNSRIEDWFHTVLYCISVSSSRLETYEIQLIETLLKKHNQVIIVATHCNNQLDEKANNMAEQLQKELKNEDFLYKLSFVPVCSVNKKTIKSQCVQFGREKLFYQIISNLWKSFWVKNRYHIFAQVNYKVKKEKNRIEKMIPRKPLVFLPNSQKRLEKFQCAVNQEIEDFNKRITAELNSFIVDLYNYYYILSQKYLGIIRTINKNDVILRSEDQFDITQKYIIEIKKIIAEIQDKVKKLHIDLPEKTLAKVSLRIKIALMDQKKLKADITKEINIVLNKLKDAIYAQINEKLKLFRQFDLNEIDIPMVFPD